MDHHDDIIIQGVLLLLFFCSLLLTGCESTKAPLYTACFITYRDVREMQKTELWS